MSKFYSYIQCHNTSSSSWLRALATEPLGWIRDRGLWRASPFCRAPRQCWQVAGARADPSPSRFPRNWFQLGSNLGPAQAVTMSHPIQHTSQCLGLSLSPWRCLVPRAGAALMASACYCSWLGHWDGMWLPGSALKDPWEVSGPRGPPASSEPWLGTMRQLSQR